MHQQQYCHMMHAPAADIADSVSVRNIMFLRTVCLSVCNFLAVQQSEQGIESGQFTLFWFAAWNINFLKPTGYVMHQLV
jgi:hypothetical protein